MEKQKSVTTDSDIEAFLLRSRENFDSAASEMANGRYNACANRCYYACFHLAIVALLRSGIRPTNVETGWGHGYVQAQFVGQLISRRKIYSASLRGTLLHLMELRHRADYEAIGVSRTQATRALQQARVFIAAVEARRSGTR